MLPLSQTQKISEKRVVVLLTDEWYYHHTLQVIQSLRIYGNYSGDICIISYWLPDWQEDEFKHQGCDVFLFDKILEHNHKIYPNIVLLKFTLFKEVFKQWDKVLYIDSDTTIRCDVNKLFEYSWINVVPEIAFFPLSCQFSLPQSDVQKKIWWNLKDCYDMTRKSFNSWVMVFETNIIHKDMYQEIIDLFYKYEDLLLLPDEAILNLYFYEKHTFLPLYYNNYIWVYSQYFPEIFKDIQEHFGIFHFIGKNKIFLKTNKNYNYYIDILHNNTDALHDINERYSSPLFLKKYDQLLSSVNKKIFHQEWLLEKKEGFYFIKNPLDVLYIN